MADISQAIINNSALTSLTSTVTLLANGLLYEGWEEVSISRSMDALAGTFSLNIVDTWMRYNLLWPLKPGIPIHVKIGLQPVLTGYIDTLEVGVSNTSRSYTISGRDKTADLVDCSARFPTGVFNLQPIESIATALCAPFAVPVVSDLVTSTPFKKWVVKQGETVFENLSRAALIQGALLLTDPFGNLKITNRAGVSQLDRSPSDLIQHYNILEMSASYDDTDRFNQYIVKGQSAGDDLFNGPAVSQVTALSTDLGVLRNRPLVVMAEGDIDLAKAQQRANWEATVRSAKACKATVKVQGWTRIDGLLWNINQSVWLGASYIGIDSEMLISGVTYSKSVDGGTTTTLELVRMDAYLPSPVIEPLKDPKTTAGWKVNAKALGWL